MVGLSTWTCPIAHDRIRPVSCVGTHVISYRHVYGWPNAESEHHNLGTKDLTSSDARSGHFAYCKMVHLDDFENINMNKLPWQQLKSTPFFSLT